MDFSLTDEQSMLADSVTRFIDNDYDFERRMKIAEGDEPFSKEIWHTFAEMGWTGMLFSEDDGGFDGGAVELMLIMEQFGRGLVVEPFLANVVLSGGVLKRAATGELRAELIAGIIEGRTQTALAFAEPQARFNLADVQTTAVAEGGRYVLNGAKSLVLNGGAADVIIVPARTSGDAGSTDGITLFAVPAESDGLAIKAYKTVDAHGAADLTLTDLTVGNDAVIGDIGKGFEALEGAVLDGTLAVSAEALGVMRAMHDKTVEYSKSRVQFGVPIGSFQALQHRMVETLMLCEESRSLLFWAVMLHGEGSDDAARAISAMKYQVGTAGRQVAQEAVQLHGGMGVTWELDIAHYFKRHTAIQMLFGNADHHLDRVADAA